MNTIIEMAKTNLTLSMSEIRDIDMMEVRIKEFLELCLHDKFDTNDVVGHGDTEIAVTRVKYRENDAIKITHNGLAYITMYRYGRGNAFTMAENYWRGFRESFRDAYMDEEYVDTVIYHLITTLVENHFLYMV